MSLLVPDRDPVLLGDLVSFDGEFGSKKQGIVIGSYYDPAGRQIIAIQLDAEVYNVWPATITHVKRTVSVARPSLSRQRTIDRRVYW